MLSEKIDYAIRIIKSAKISIKLTIVYTFLFSIALLILNASILFGVKYYIYNQANKQIEDMQAILTNKIKSEENTKDLSDTSFFSDIPTKENISIKISTKDGITLNSSQVFDYKLSGQHKNKKQANGKEKHIEDEERHLVYKNITFQSKKYGTIFIQIVKEMHSEYEFMNILFGVMATADFIGILISIIMGYIVSKRMLKPIANITKTAENISINNLKERIEVIGLDDELKRLTNTFNNMIDRLQGSFDRQAQFVSDASHELRTPIAVIQGYANLLDRWGKNDKEALEKSIYGIKYEAENMANLIEKLLFLAKGDSGSQIIEKKEFFLNELIDEVVSESRLIEAERTISSNKNDKVKILADYKMIKQMLRILIDNSIKFTSDNGTIYINSESVGKEVKITVKDNGIGIPKDELDNIFDRFYIVDKSRSKEYGGTGLGLSIAKWIVNMHKGTINVQSEEGKWTEITVKLLVGN